MTEPKEEKCEACCGSGYINFWTDDGHISMRTCRRCDGYGYIKVKPMTNEEWLRQCTTEQLAEYLWRSKKSYWNTHLEDTDKMEIEDMLWWLQQPHKE